MPGLKVCSLIGATLTENEQQHPWGFHRQRMTPDQIAEAQRMAREWMAERQQ